jgi:CheY-like chemotaxis protein
MEAMRVMLVDDNLDAIQSLAMLLQLEDYETAVYDNPLAALEAASARCPGAAIVDIAMPGMNGHELAARLRELPGCTGIAIAAITAYDSPQARENSKKAGIELHIRKPADLREILAFLERARSREAA